jgi:hypothetical protein
MSRDCRPAALTTSARTSWVCCSRAPLRIRRSVGTRVSSDAFAAATKEHGASIVGISALLTTTMVGIMAAVGAIRAVDPKAKILVDGAR